MKAGDIYTTESGRKVLVCADVRGEISCEKCCLANLNQDIEPAGDCICSPCLDNGVYFTEPQEDAQ